MDFTSQYFMEILQDPLVLVLVIIGLLLGVVLGRIGSRSTAKTPRKVDGAAGHEPRSGSTARDSIPKPAVPEAQQHEPPLPDAVLVQSTMAQATAHVSPEPVRKQAPPPVAADPEPAVGPRTEARIHTRTGANPSKAKLVDPHAESERVWSKMETTRAVALYRSGKSLVPIAHLMRIDQRQVAICLIRALFAFDGEIEDLSAAPRHGKQYSQEDVSKLQSHSDAGAPIQDIATALERTVLGVGWKMLDRRMT